MVPATSGRGVLRPPTSEVTVTEPRVTGLLRARVCRGLLGVALVGATLLGGTGCEDDTPMSSLPTALPTSLPTALPSLPSITSRPSLPVLRPGGDDSTAGDPAGDGAGQGSGDATAPATAPEGTTTPTGAATTEPTPTGTQPAGEEDGSRSWWPLVAVVAAVVAALLWFLRRRTRPRRDWDRRMDSVVSQLHWVVDSVVVTVLASSTPAEAASVWGSARPHLVAVDADLDALSTADVDRDRRARAQDLRPVVSDLVAAVDLLARSGPGDDEASVVQHRTAVVRARDRLRSALGVLEERTR